MWSGFEVVAQLEFLNSSSNEGEVTPDVTHVATVICGVSADACAQQTKG